MIQSVLAEQWAITQDTETRHLVHTWQDTDVLESVGKPLRPHSYSLHVCPPRRASAAPVWNQHLVNTSKGEPEPSRLRLFLTFLKKKKKKGDMFDDSATRKPAGHRFPHMDVSLSVSCVPGKKTEEQKLKSWDRGQVPGSSDGLIPETSDQMLSVWENPKLLSWNTKSTMFFFPSTRIQTLSSCCIFFLMGVYAQAASKHQPWSHILNSTSMCLYSL